MKAHIDSIARSLGAALSWAATGSLFLALFLAIHDEPRVMTLCVGVWLGAMALQALLCEGVASLGLSMLVYAGANLLALIALTHEVTARTAFSPEDFGSLFFLGLICVGTGLRTAFAALHPPSSDHFVRCSDTLIVSIALYLLAVFGLNKPLDPITLGFALFSLAFIMALTALLRAGGESESVIRGAGAGGWLVLLALLAICLLLTAGLLALGSGNVDGVIALVSALWALVGRAGNMLLTAFVRLLALFRGVPRLEPDVSMGMEDLVDIPDMSAVAPAPEWVAPLIIALGALLALAFLIALALFLRGMKIGRVRIRRTQRRVTRSSHALSAFAAFIRRIRARIAFEMAYRAARRTPQGLLVLAERTCRLAHGRKPSESAGAYVRRLAHLLRAGGGDCTLEELAALLDRALFSGETVSLSRAQADAFARDIRRLRFSKKA